MFLIHETLLESTTRAHLHLQSDHNDSDAPNYSHLGIYKVAAVGYIALQQDPAASNFNFSVKHKGKGNESKPVQVFLKFAKAQKAN